MQMRSSFARLLLCLPLWGAAVGARELQQRSFGQAPAQHKQLGRRAAAFTADEEKREAIKTAFLDNYANYEKYAAPSDKLKPVAKAGTNDSILAGFGGTIIDSLSTMLVMGLGDSDAYQRALAHAKTIDFTQTAEGDEKPGDISVFELTIRYIGGMLSAYQLNGEKPEEKFLVDQVVVLADRLSKAWYKGNRLPFNRFNLNLTTPVDTTDSVGIAEAGSLILEWGELSAYTGNNTYLNLTEGAMDAIIASPVTFPGIFAQSLDAYNESTSGPPYYTWGGGSDSFWEYLIKWGQLRGLDRNSAFVSTWDAAINSSIAHLIQKTGVANLTLLADYDPASGPVYVSSHLASFAGGNWALGGALLNKPEYIQVGLEMAESYWRTYNGTATGIGPESFGYFDAAGNAKGWTYVSPGRREFYNEHGFFLGSPGYIQRPETVESLFYGWRLTGQQIFRDMAWDAFLHMKEYIDTGTGWVGLVNVNDISSGSYDEAQTLFAELFKYLYLIFDDPEHISLDEYVFTTEAHPFKIKAPNPAFGKVQNFWPYEPLSGQPESGAQANAVEPDSGAPPFDGLTSLVTLAGGIQEAAKAFAQQVQMPVSVARNMFGGLANAPAVN